jgi:hypothetical protein
MEGEELKRLLEKHKLWLEGKEGGERVDLSGVDLRGANLRGINLSNANLTGAKLDEAILSEAKMTAARFDPRHGRSLEKSFRRRGSWHSSSAERLKTMDGSMEWSTEAPSEFFWTKWMKTWEWTSSCRMECAVAHVPRS